MKKIVIAWILALTLVLSLVGVASAITNGEPDGDNHPYVGIALGAATGGGYWVCSAAAISPTVVVTAAHCFEGPDVWVTFDEVPDFGSLLSGPPNGKWYPDPEWCIGCGNGLPGFDSHDVAVIVLDEPVTLPRYAQLPTEGLVDTLGMKTDIDSVGYGIQFDQGGGPRYPEDGAFTRYYAHSQLITSKHVHSDEYIKLTANPSQDKGGTCFGNSGGPNLLGDTDTILAVNSYVTNGNCAGVTYSNRIDTYALEFINSFITDVTGTWRGESGLAGTMGYWFDMVLTQEADGNVTGTVNYDIGIVRTVTGSVYGNMFTFVTHDNPTNPTIPYWADCAPCSVSLDGTYFHGFGTSSSNQNIEWEANKQ